MSDKPDKNKLKITCVCGVSINRTSKARHIESTKHINLMKELSSKAPGKIKAEPKLEIKIEDEDEIILPDIEIFPCVKANPPPKPLSVNLYRLDEVWILTINEPDDMFDRKQLLLEQKLIELKAIRRKSIKIDANTVVEDAYVITPDIYYMIKAFLDMMGIFIIKH